jgi:hypothetical protein
VANAKQIFENEYRAGFLTAGPGNFQASSGNGRLQPERKVVRIYLIIILEAKKRNLTQEQGNVGKTQRRRSWATLKMILPH